MFRFFVQRNPLSDVTKGLAKGSLIVGLFLIGIGLLDFILRDIFAFIAAAIFFIAGFSALGYAVRLFILQYKMKKPTAMPPKCPNPL
jgi:hypothetical protein